MKQVDRRDLKDRLRVGVHVVTFNSAETIELCLKSVLEQELFVIGDNLRVIVTDNASTDSTRESLERVGQVEKRFNPRNLGFSEAHNIGIAELLNWGAEFVLVLNPDVRLEANALSLLVETLAHDTRAGLATPKLLRADCNLNAQSPPRLDSTGIYVTPPLRHFDRGSEEIDSATYSRPEYVFGATGACVLLRRNFILDVAHTSERDTKAAELFDNDFFAYREDADLAWRAQILGWKCRYEPRALGYHKRVVLPERRKVLAPQLNALGVQNRFLLQLKNFSFRANFRCLLPGLIRNIIVVGGVLIVERSSLPALKNVLSLAPQMVKKRRATFKKRRLSMCSIAAWFRYSPSAQPAISFERAASKVKSLTIVIVNFNSEQELAKCVDSLVTNLPAILSNLSVRVVIADNSSTDESIKSIESNVKEHPEFQIRRHSTNLGFAGAINEVGLHDTSDALLILNPDIQIDAANITSLVASLDAHKNLGAVSPILYGQNSKPQLGFIARRFPCVTSTLSELFYLHRLWPKNPWTSHYKMDDDFGAVDYFNRQPLTDKIPAENPTLALVVNQPAGACLLIRREAFATLKGFDETFYPAWYEDVDFCKRLANSGWVSAIQGAASAVHLGGHSLKALSPSEFAEYWYSNCIRYWKTHGAISERALLAISLPLALTIRAAIALVLQRHDLARALFRLALNAPKKLIITTNNKVSN